MDKKEENERIEYSIPGVIIPAQRTDSGIIGGDISSNNDTNNAQLASSEISNVDSTQANTTVNVNSNQVSINNNSQVASIVSSNESIANSSNIAGNNMNVAQNVVVSNIVPDANSNSVNNSGYPNNINQQIQTQTVNAIPSVVTQPPKKNKKQKKGGNSPLLILLVVILLGAVGYFVYNDYIAPKEVIDPVKELERKRSVNINSLLVQQLYSYVDLDGCGDQINFFYGTGEPVELKNLTNEQKNYLAYRQLLNKDIKKENCSNYSKALHRNDKMSLWYCGEEYLNSNSDNFDDSKSITNVISEDILKSQVEKMFGKGNYKAVTFTTSTSFRYLYDQTTASYIYQTFYGGDSCKGYTNKLDSAYRKGDDITIVVKVVNNERKNITMFYYTFRESDDGNYYFSNLVKKAA